MIVHNLFNMYTENAWQKYQKIKEAEKKYKPCAEPSTFDSKIIECWVKLWSCWFTLLVEQFLSVVNFFVMFFVGFFFVFFLLHCSLLISRFGSNLSVTYSEEMSRGEKPVQCHIYFSSVYRVRCVCCLGSGTGGKNERLWLNNAIIWCFVHTDYRYNLMWYFTSGNTGQPVGAHRTLISNWHHVFPLATDDIRWENSDDKKWQFNLWLRTIVTAARRVCNFRMQYEMIW